MSQTSPELPYMRRAIELSRRGFPAPNPHVGCVIVKHGVIVGEGYHSHAGAPHAEAMALAEAGSSAEGADVYVTLEPCNHTGRTPPCSLALKEASVARVFIACPDPNPKAQGGTEALTADGIEVQSGILSEEAAAANHQFLFAMAERRPLVVAKAAISLDGRIALASGESKWITSEQAREEAHRLRAELGAVLVGSGTVLADDPHLTARVEGVFNQPVRVVLDGAQRLSRNERVFDEAAETIHLTGDRSPAQVLSELFERGITGVLVEGGATTIGRFVTARLVDRFELFVAPKLLGGGKSWLEGLALETLSDAPLLKIEQVEQVGPDLRITAAPVR